MTLLMYSGFVLISHMSFMVLIICIISFSFFQAVTVRNSMAKSLYSALFDWIVFRINHALMNSKDLEQNIKVDIYWIIIYFS